MTILAETRYGCQEGECSPSLTECFHVDGDTLLGRRKVAMAAFLGDLEELGIF